jgi:hypothetical protein
MVACLPSKPSKSEALVQDPVPPKTIKAKPPHTTKKEGKADKEHMAD